jgi:hypothetical protein
MFTVVFGRDTRTTGHCKEPDLESWLIGLRVARPITAGGCYPVSWIHGAWLESH